MSTVEFWSDCIGCGYAQESDGASVAEERAEKHARENPGHRVHVYRRWLPDGGIDTLVNVSFCDHGRRTDEACRPCDEDAFDDSAAYVGREDALDPAKYR